MRADLIVKGKSLTGSSDLTLLAPLKAGLVPSLDAVSYKTRTQRLLRLLSGGRTTSHEYALHRPISDSVERVARIHSVRVAVLEPEDKVLLAVSFDGTWEAYLRVLWQKVGSLLDAIFCNTDDYVLSTAGFAEWSGWVARVQVETGFFFNTHALSVGDVHYLRETERIQRSEACPHAASLATVRASIRSAEDIAYEVGQTTTLGAADALRQGLQSLALLYRLADLYLPGTPDGEVLVRASRDLLMEFCPLVEDPNLPPEIGAPVQKRFGRQLAWLRSADRPQLLQPRPVPALPARLEFDRADVQGGMLEGYKASQGCLLLLAFDDAAAGAAFLQSLRPRITTAADPADGAGVFCNIAFSHEGLRQLGLTEAELAAWLPPEFREGMEARASMLGDFRANHPRRWPLPRTNWCRPGGADPVPVQLSAVHAVLQLRQQVGPDADAIDDPVDPAYPLHREIVARVGEPGHPRPGLRVLSVQPMRRLHNDDNQVIEHFGFADGDGQPEFAPATPPRSDTNRVPLGELLLGHANEADPAPTAADRADADRLRFLHNGSFMVVRKLRQRVARLRSAVRDAAAETGLAPEYVYAKMMGRWRNGGSLIGWPDAAPPRGTAPDRDFTFDDDPEGRRCPLHAHVRRVHPRTGAPGRGEPPGRRRARLLRRGMSYGPQLPEGANGDDRDDGVDRGLVFIAYNASIAEQFEVVQRWIVGGNSSGGFSGHSDPFLGVPEPGQRRHFRFEARSADGAVLAYRIALDDAPAPFEAPAPFVRLQWGAYLFVPSMATLAWLQQRAADARPAPDWSADDGQRTIDRLERLADEQGEVAAREAWKSALEDPGAQEQLRAASLWAAIREQHGGALRTPYGVLVAGGALIDEVLGDDRRFSVCGYAERMRAGRFEIYLGLDHGPRYEALANDVNAAIGRLTQADAFALAATSAEAVLRAFIDGERASSAGAGLPAWELNLDAREVFDSVLQRLCQQWLGLPAKGGALQPGSWRWDWRDDQPPIYPTHFTPPSRYFFQPRPGENVRRYGERYAGALSATLEAFVAPHRAGGSVPAAPDGTPAPLAQAILDAQRREDDATVARTFAGVLMGFLPTLDGNLRLILNEWLRLQTFWSLRAAWVGDAAPFDLDKAQRLLEPALTRAMQFRPSPELIWRTAQRDGDRIGGVPLRRGDIVVAGLVSATHEALGAGRDDLCPVFGGDRAAPRHPTHACPGRDAALGVLLGVLAAFVGAPGMLRPSPAPLAFTFEGPV